MARDDDAPGRKSVPAPPPTWLVAALVAGGVVAYGCLLGALVVLLTDPDG